jgi:L-lactate dehydrogenase (cytochrome)
MGEAGVTKVLELIRNELDLTMAFCGRTRLADVDASVILPGTAPQRRSPNGG